MRLKLVCVQKYKRFATRTCLDTRGPVVAIVGPYEAGKISLLNAITHLNVLDLGRERGRLGDPARADQLRELHDQLVKAVETTSVDGADEGADAS